MRQCIILKGTSGSGKSSFAELIAQPSVICTADDWFVNDKGNYNFDATKLGLAHGACREKFDIALSDESVQNIVIANTNVKPQDYQYYVDRAEKAGLRVFHVVLEKRHDGKNTHNVPDETLQRQHKTLCDNLKLI